MSTYAVSASVMQATSADLATISANIQGLLDSMESDVEKLLVYWTGSAQDQYKAAKTNWDSAAQNLPTAVSQAQQVLDRIINEYLAAEGVAGNMFSA